MNKTILIVTVALIAITTAMYLFLEEEYGGEVNSNGEVSTTSPFIECLAESGVVIYGSATCPACAQLLTHYTDYNGVEEIYIDCIYNEERCQNEMLANFVPSVQIDGELVDIWPSPEELSRETGCELVK